MEAEITVIKRDGNRVPYEGIRIVNAVSKAANACGIRDLNLGANIEAEVFKRIRDKHEIAISEIQKVVEDQLMASKFKQVARAYIEYRHDRDRMREKQSDLIHDIESLIEQNNPELLNENANKDSRVIPTQRDLLAGIVARHYAKQHMLPADVVQAHERGEIHFHDLDYSPLFPMFNCMLIDIKGMLTHGFKMGNAEIETPRSICTATAVTAQIIAQVASHIYGGTTINRIDEVLAPYVTSSYEKHLAVAREWKIADVESYARARTEKECYDAFQSLEYEVNTLHTANGQTPFVTLGFGLGTSWESRLIQQSILKNRIAGLGKNHKTAVFPKLVFTIKRGLNLEKNDPNYDIKQLALECASKRMYPDILNYEQVLRVTGSFKALMERIHRLDNVQAKVAPILYMEGACGVRLKENDKVSEIFKNGRATVSLGYIGIHETINALYGNKEHIFDNEDLRAKGIRIVKTLHDATVRWKAKTGYGFSLYSTPSENLCNRFCKLDTKEFGIIPGVTDKGYYTNSFHLDVEKKVDPYAKIDFEQPYPELASGGFICYGEFPNLEKNPEAIEDVWNYAYDRVPYYGTNTPIDECYECGYRGEFSCTSKGFVCPKCGNANPNKASVIRRVCGYLGAPDTRPFNAGKQEEVRRRVKHF